MIHTYEAVIIFNTDMTEDTRKELIQNCSTMIRDNSAGITKIDEWGEKNLAYLIHGHKKGYYVTYTFKGTGEDAEHIDKRIGSFPDVIKYIIVENDYYADKNEVCMNSEEDAVNELTAMDILFE